VTVLLINLDAERSTEVEVDGFSEARALRFEMTAPDAASRVVFLNGDRLDVDASAALPRLEGATSLRQREGWTVKPLSYSFVVFPDANAAACL
jgi:hypothetical protein